MRNGSAPCRARGTRADNEPRQVLAVLVNVSHFQPHPSIVVVCIHAREYAVTRMTGRMRLCHNPCPRRRRGQKHRSGSCADDGYRRAYSIRIILPTQRNTFLWFFSKNLRQIGLKLYGRQWNNKSFKTFFNLIIIVVINNCT